MNQAKTSFEELSKKMDEFDKQRDWLGLDPADLAKSIVLEAAELLELYQWDNTLNKRNQKIPQKDKQEIAFEVADILIYLLKFCREEKIDIVEATLQKLEKAGKKYPADYKKGGHDAEEYLRIKKAHRKNPIK